MEAPATPRAEGPLIHTREVRREFHLGSKTIMALRGVDMTIARGAYVALKGRSGSGKTTLLSLVGGLDRPTAGVVQVFGRDLATFGENELALWRRHELGFVFQSFGLLPSLSAYENVDLMLRLIGMPRTERRVRTLDCIELVGLRKWMDHRPHELSGGQQQRVGIARALANRPKLILADEPTGELDSNTSIEILQLFRRIVESEGVTILMSSHDPLVDRHVDQVLLLQDGRIVNGAG